MPQQSELLTLALAILPSMCVGSTTPHPYTHTDSHAAINQLASMINSTFTKTRMPNYHDKLATHLTLHLTIAGGLYSGSHTKLNQNPSRSNPLALLFARSLCQGSPLGAALATVGKLMDTTWDCKLVDD